MLSAAANSLIAYVAECESNARLKSNRALLSPEAATEFPSPTTAKKWKIKEIKQIKKKEEAASQGERTLEGYAPNQYSSRVPYDKERKSSRTAKEQQYDYYRRKNHLEIEKLLPECVIILTLKIHYSTLAAFSAGV